MRGFAGKGLIKLGSQLPQRPIGSRAADVCHHYEPKIRPRPKHRGGKIHRIEPVMSYYPLNGPPSLACAHPSAYPPVFGVPAGAFSRTPVEITGV